MNANERQSGFAVLHRISTGKSCSTASTCQGERLSTKGSTPVFVHFAVDDAEAEAG